MMEAQNAIDAYLRVKEAAVAVGRAQVAQGSDDVPAFDEASLVSIDYDASGTVSITLEAYKYEGDTNYFDISFTVSDATFEAYL